MLEAEEGNIPNKRTAHSRAAVPRRTMSSGFAAATRARHAGREARQRWGRARQTGAHAQPTLLKPAPGRRSSAPVLPARPEQASSRAMKRWRGAFFPRYMPVTRRRHAFCFCPSAPRVAPVFSPFLPVLPALCVCAVARRSLYLPHATKRYVPYACRNAETEDKARFRPR